MRRGGRKKGPAAGCGTSFPIKLYGRAIWKISSSLLKLRRPKELTLTSGDGGVTVTQEQCGEKGQNILSRPSHFYQGFDLLYNSYSYLRDGFDSLNKTPSFWKSDLRLPHPCAVSQKPSRDNLETCYFILKPKLACTSLNKPSNI